jgi:hypothetical protein
MVPAEKRQRLDCHLRGGKTGQRKIVRRVRYRVPFGLRDQAGPRPVASRPV